MNQELKISFWHPASLISTCFGVGKIPFAPGTFGSVFGVMLLWIKMSFLLMIGFVGFDNPVEQAPDYTNFYITYYGLLVLFFPASLWAMKKYMERTGREDPKEVVIDEVYGVIIAYEIWGNLINFGGFHSKSDLKTWLVVAIPFIAFRFFDITKPLLVGWADRNVKGAWGVMLDDIIAGIFAGIASSLIFLVF